MRINQVNSVSKDLIFRSNYIDNNRKFYNSKSDNDKTLMLGLIGLAIIGTAAVGTAILKRKNTNPAEVIKNAAGMITKNLPKKQPQDPIARRLGSKRDARAVIVYNGLRAQQKIKSLEERYLNGEFNNIKDKEKVMNYIAKNKQKLLRAAEHVC